MRVYLHTKLEVSSTIVTSFRQGGNFTPATSKRTHKKPTQMIRVKQQVLELRKLGIGKQINSQEL